VFEQWRISGSSKPLWNVDERETGTSKDVADNLVRGIKRKTRKQYSAEEKIRIVLAVLRGEESIAALRRPDAVAGKKAPKGGCLLSS
jgi:hypothetical protein